MFDPPIDAHPLPAFILVTVAPLTPMFASKPVISSAELPVIVQLVFCPAVTFEHFIVMPNAAASTFLGEIMSRKIPRMIHIITIVPIIRITHIILISIFFLLLSTFFSLTLCSLNSLS